MEISNANDVILDTISSLPALLGGNAIKNEASDPNPSKERGYYFDGSNGLHLPPHSEDSGTIFTLPADFSVQSWIRPKSGGSRTLFAA